MYVQVRLLSSETLQINCRSVNELIDDLRDKVARKFAESCQSHHNHDNIKKIASENDQTEEAQLSKQKLINDLVIDASRVRLFFDGKELKNGHSLFDYDIKVNNFIQALIKEVETEINVPEELETTTTTTTTIEQESEKERIEDEESFYFNAGITKPPDCSECLDDSERECKSCSCHECGGKNSPDKQIICDECDSIFHIWCLKVPLNSIPEEDWYCDSCRNDIHQKHIENVEDRRLAMRQNSLNRTGVREWGRGMACVGRSKIAEIEKDYFGPISGIEVGTWWRFRFQASEAGVHTPLVAGIHGKESLGAYSIVFCCSYADDIDLGDEFYYTASGGKETCGKPRVGGPQTKDQELKRCNKALAMNCAARFCPNGASAGLNWRDGKPVRVLRSGNARGATKKSPYLPKVGVRYDGIYKVVKYWSQIGESGFLIWRFLLRRDEICPSPWTKEGKTRSRKLGLQLIYPPGWNENTASKRAWKADENAFKKTKMMKAIPFVFPKSVTQLIQNDHLNHNLWKSLQVYARQMGKMEFFHKLEETFKCAFCLDLIQQPITTSCKHHFCKSCMTRALQSDVHQCPTCRNSIKKNQLKSNHALKQILETFQSI